MIERARGYFWIKDDQGERMVCMLGFGVKNEELTLMGDSGNAIKLTGDIFDPDESDIQYFGGGGGPTFARKFFAVNPDGSSIWKVDESPVLLSVEMAGKI